MRSGIALTIMTLLSLTGCSTSRSPGHSTDDIQTYCQYLKQGLEAPDFNTQSNNYKSNPAEQATRMKEYERYDCEDFEPYTEENLNDTSRAANPYTPAGVGPTVGPTLPL